MHHRGHGAFWSLAPSSLVGMLRTEACLSLLKFFFFVVVVRTGDDDTQVPDARVGPVQWECGKAPGPQAEQLVLMGVHL